MRKCESEHVFSDNAKMYKMRKFDAKDFAFIHRHSESVFRTFALSEKNASSSATTKPLASVILLFNEV